MKIDIFLDPAIDAPRRVTLQRLLGKMGLITRFLLSPFALIFPAISFSYCAYIFYLIFSKNNGLASIGYIDWFIFVWIMITLPSQIRMVKNFIISRGKSHMPLPKSVEGLNHGPATIKLTETALLMEAPMEKESISWEAITDVKEHKGQFYLSCHHNYIVTIPTSEKARQFFKAKDYL